MKTAIGTAVAIANLSAFGIVLPTDVARFIRDARTALTGTDTEHALELGHALTRVLKNEGFQPREIRLFAARYTVALEDYDDEAFAAVHAILETLALVDFKNYHG